MPAIYAGAFLSTFEVLHDRVMMQIEFPLRVISGTFDKASIESKFIEDMSQLIRDRHRLEIVNFSVGSPASLPQSLQPSTTTSPN